MTGIICINKDKDITSFGVVAKIRGITREKKPGIQVRLTQWQQVFCPLCLAVQQDF